MRPLSRLTNGIHALFRRRIVDEELDGELHAFLEAAVDEKMRSGMSREEATRAARLETGLVSTDSVKERVRDVGWEAGIDTIWQDLRFAVRRLIHEPSFAAVCVLTLAVAIGANTAIFSAVNAALIRPLPYPDPDSLVQVWETNPQAERWGDWASYPDFEDWAREARAFDGLALYRLARLRLTHGEYPEMLVAVLVSPSLFSVLRVDPMLGRPFLAEEGRPGQTDVAILSYGLWQRQFGSDQTIIGQPVPLDGRNYLVVGVMPPRFDFPTNLRPTARPPDVWIPVVPDTDRGSHNYRVVGRLKAGQTTVQASADMERVMRIVADLDPAHRGRGAAVAGLQRHTVTAVRPSLLLLMGAVVFVLLISCANVSGLLLARGAARQREVALRLALGAASSRVLQQAVIEGVALALVGAAAGLLVAHAGIRVLVELAPALPLVKEASLDVRVLTFTIVTALAAGIVFGIVPTVQALKVQANDVLKEGGTRQAGGARVSAMRTLLTVGEVALALVLLIGAALFLRSFANVRSVEAGFDPTGVVTAFLAAPPLDASDAPRTVQFFERVIARLEEVPGVSAVAGSSAVPLISNETSPFRVEGVEPAAGQDLAYAEQPKVTLGYFRAMGIGVLRGRTFSESDVGSGEPVAIVSKGLADRYWPSGEVLGKRVAITDRTWRRIVGIVQDVRNDGLEASAKPTIYIPFGQFPRAQISLIVRTEGNSLTATARLRDAVRDVAPTQPLFGIQTMEQVLGESVSLRRFLMLLIGIFAGIAVLLGLVGVYGVLAYLVGQRRQEIAIRVALGGTRSEIVWLVARRGLILASAGVTLGLAASVVLSRVIEGTLFGVSALDPLSYVLAPALLLAVVIAASSLPAWRATRVPAFVALRGE
jgi:putative ABC transport system permease protein